MTLMYDVAVLGATPAGLAAAAYLARHRLQVAVVDAPSPSVDCPLSDWVPKGFLDLGGLPPGFARDCKAAPFANVSYHSVKLDQQVDFRSRGAVGHFVQAGAVGKVLRAACAKAGIRIRPSTTTPAIRLEEDHVELVGTCQVSASLLIIAQSRPNDVMSELAMPLRTVPDGNLVVAALDVPLKPAAAKKLAGTLHVVELRERSELGVYFAAGENMHLRVISNSPASGNRAVELSQMVSCLQQRGLVPADLAVGKAKGAVWRPPAGVALELETHVAKRCLLAGTAGGFAESITGQSLSASVRSALLAAKVAADALGSKDVQGELMQFKTSWRQTLADSLRPPNTSLHMLLPLLFVNERIVSKFTRALLYGESI
jgi:flavin-dependent dehydrogenase